MFVFLKFFFCLLFIFIGKIPGDENIEIKEITIVIEKKLFEIKYISSFYL